MTLVRKGECNQCGICCNVLYREEGKAVIDTKLETDTTNLKERVPAFTCKYFSYVDGLGVCALQDSKPDACINWPIKPEDIENIPECGYYFEEE